MSPASTSTALSRTRPTECRRRSRPTLRWAICAALAFAAWTTACQQVMAASSDPVDTTADAATPVEAKPSGADSEGASLGAIIAGCFGVVFGALVARWQIKARQRREAG